MSEINIDSGGNNIIEETAENPAEETENVIEDTETEETAEEITEEKAEAETDGEADAEAPEETAEADESADDTVVDDGADETDDADDAEEAPAEPASQQPKQKPTRRRRKAKRRVIYEDEKHSAPVGLIVTAVILAVLILGAISLNYIITPEAVANKFVNALMAKDFETLKMTAEVSDGTTTLTETNTAGMFALYDNDEAFRNEVAQILTQDARLLTEHSKPQTGNVVDMKEINLLLFRLFKVVIAENDAVVYTNFNGAKVTLDGMTKLAYSTEGYDYNTYGLTVSEDYYNQVRSKAVFEGLLPGAYEVHVEYLSSFGDTFTADGKMEYGKGNVECELNLEYASVEITNATEYDVTVSIGDKGSEILPAGGTYKMFPVNEGEEITVLCDAEDGTTTRKVIIAGKDEAFELCFAGVTVNSANAMDVDYYINGVKSGTVPANAENYRIYPVNLGDELYFRLANDEFAGMVEEFTVSVDEAEITAELDFTLKSQFVSGIDELITKDITESFEIVNMAYTMTELQDKVVTYRTLAEMMDYADYETAGIYSTLSEPQITIDKDSTTKAYIVDSNSVKMCVNVNVAFSVGYHEKNKQPKEQIEKTMALTYTLEYVDGAWRFEEAVG